MALFRNLAAASALFCGVSIASADVLTFDDLGPGRQFFLSNYQGFMFGTNDIDTTAWFHTSEVSPFYKPKSGANYVATDFGLYVGQPTYIGTQAISNTIPFVFDGAWFSGGDPVGYQLYLDNTIVHTTGPSPTVEGVPLFVASNFSGLVTSVVVFGNQGFYAMDDFTFNTAAIPEPQTNALMLAGLAVVGVSMLRRRRSR